MNLTGNKVIITGATRGIGLAILEKFYALGNDVIAVARNEKGLERLKHKFPKIITIQADLSEQTSIDNLIENILLNHKDANTLINNAGVQVSFYDNKFGEVGDRMKALQTEIQVNYTTPIELTYRLIPLLVKNKNASIVNVSSGLALAPKKSAPVYCGTKAGIHIFTKALRYQYENTDLKIFEIIPPLVATDMTKERDSKKATPKQLAAEFIKNYGKNKYEINIGKVKLLRLIQRFSPSIADKILKNG